MDSTVFIVLLGAIVGGFVQGLSGFAFGLVSMSFWAWALEPRLAAPLAVFGALTGQIVAAISVRRGFNSKLLAPFLAGGLIGVPVGVMILPLLNVHLFKAALGLLLVVWCPFMLFASRLRPVTFGGRFADGVAGLFGGILGGIGGFSGPVPTLWCTLRRLERDTQRSIIQNFNLTMLACAMAGHVATGTVTRAMLPLFAIVAPAMLVPTLLGAKVYVGLSEESFRRIVLTLLTLSGIAFLASALPYLL